MSNFFIFAFYFLWQTELSSTGADAQRGCKISVLLDTQNETGQGLTNLLLLVLL